MTSITEDEAILADLASRILSGIIMSRGLANTGGYAKTAVRLAREVIEELREPPPRPVNPSTLTLPPPTVHLEPHKKNARANGAGATAPRR